MCRTNSGRPAAPQFIADALDVPVRQTQSFTNLPAAADQEAFAPPWPDIVGIEQGSITTLLGIGTADTGYRNLCELSPSSALRARSTLESLGRSVRLDLADLLFCQMTSDDLRVSRWIRAFFLCVLLLLGALLHASPKPAPRTLRLRLRVRVRGILGHGRRVLQE